MGNWSDEKYANLRVDSCGEVDDIPADVSIVVRGADGHDVFKLCLSPSAAKALIMALTYSVSAVDSDKYAHAVVIEEVEYCT